MPCIRFYLNGYIDHTDAKHQGCLVGFATYIQGYPAVYKCAWAHYIGKRDVRGNVTHVITH